MNRRDVIKGFAASCAALSIPTVSHAAHGRILIGQSAAFSGASAEPGLGLNTGASAYIASVNAQGGVGGNLIELRAYDDSYEPDHCRQNTERLINEGALALFGYVGTPTSLAALPLALDANVPFFAPRTGAQALRYPFRKSVFHLRASYFDETALIVKQLTYLDLDKIAVFYQNDEYGRDGLEGVTRALQLQGLKPIAAATFERNTIDVAKAVTDICSAGPDAVVQVGTYAACAAFIRQARKAGYGGSFFNVSFVGTQSLIDELGKEAYGIIVTQVVPFPYAPTTPIAREYLEAIRKANYRPTYGSMEGYLGAKVLIEGLRRAGNYISRETLIAGLETLQGEQFGGFGVHFSPTEHAASTYVDLSMLTGDGKVRI